MTLGEKLGDTIARIEKEKRDEDDRKAAEKREADRRRRAGRKEVIMRVIREVTTSIEAGKVPAVKIKDYDDQKWVRKGFKGNSRDQDIWDQLMAWGQEQGLHLSPREDHDGMGIESWITIAVTPAPRPEAHVADTRGHDDRV